MKDEKMSLEHEPQPGYQGAFYIVLVLAVIYLAIVFIESALQ
jgi:hypothetical protein